MDTTLESSPESTSQDLDTGSNRQDLSDMPDLDKADRFRFEGRDWTRDELKAAYLRQQDYTRKTQSLADERRGFEENRKAFESDRKYYENLPADLDAVRKNPSLAQQFIQTYPEKFHQALKMVLNGQTSQMGQNTQNAQPQFPVEYMSRIAKLESFYEQQEVAKHEATINQTMGELSKKYPDALQELVVARVHEHYNQLLKENPNATLSQSAWENAFKQVDQFMKDRDVSRTREMQKKQLEANKRSGDVSSGGGTIGRAPQKFNSLKEVTKHAERELTRER